VELARNLLVQVGVLFLIKPASVLTSRSIPFGALAVLGIYALWPDERRNRYDATTAVSKIDFLGNILLAAASILLVFAMQEAGSFVWSWSSPVIIGTLATAVACWALLATWEYYLCRASRHGIQPIFPRSLARNRVYLSCLLYDSKSLLRRHSSLTALTIP
jgi:protein-S-isoprenylcysteine O-methyltransferase Ste14